MAMGLWLVGGRPVHTGNGESTLRRGWVGAHARWGCKRWCPVGMRCGGGRGDASEVADDW